MADSLDSTSRNAFSTKTQPEGKLMPSGSVVLGQITPPPSPDNGKGVMQQVNWDSLETESLMAWHGSYDIRGEIGEGAWSKVYAAVENSTEVSTQVGQTPPASPRNAQLDKVLSSHTTSINTWTARTAKRGSLLAIKSSAHKMAGPILLHEAKILSYLAAQTDCTKHIIDFYGQDAETKALVFGRGDKTLMDIIRNASKMAPESLPKNDPLTTTPFWLSCVKQLISGLTWIHSHNIVHVDIKPANILSLQDEKKFVYADFSSSFHLSPDGTYEARPTDAITTQYASPELLKSYSLSRPITDTSPRHPTFASDVWALACTLLVAATGYEPYAFAGHEMRRLAMAKDGSVIASYMNADDWRVGMRVKQGGIVERVVRPALVKLVDKRIDCLAWGKLVRDIAAEV